MATYTFGDRNEQQRFVPAGDYILGIIYAECGLSKSSGNEMLTVQLCVVADKMEKEVGPDAKDIVIREYIPLDGKMDWKLDVLLKAIRNPPQKGETIDLSADWLKANLIGRVGWAKLTVTEEEYKGKKIKKNEIVQWIATGKADPNAKWRQEVPAEDDVPI